MHTVVRVTAHLLTAKQLLFLFPVFKKREVQQIIVWQTVNKGLNKLIAEDFVEFFFHFSTGWRRLKFFRSILWGLQSCPQARKFKSGVCWGYRKRQRLMFRKKKVGQSSGFPKDLHHTRLCASITLCFFSISFRHNSWNDNHRKNIY